MNDYRPEDHSAARATQQQTYNLMFQMQKMSDEKRIMAIKLEMAKTTDPIISMQLQSLLDEIQADIDERKRKEKIFAVVVMIIGFTVLAGIGLYFLFYGNDAAVYDPPVEPQNVASITVDTSGLETPANETSESIEAVPEVKKELASPAINNAPQTVDTTNLTHDQIIHWLTAVADEYQRIQGRNDDYTVAPLEAEQVALRESDSLYYIIRFHDVGGGFFVARINPVGLLEIELNTTNRLEGEAYSYKAISSEFMDVAGVQYWIDSIENLSNMQSAETIDYYQVIYAAWEQQKNYIESIEDPKIKQSVQSSLSAAIGEAYKLSMLYPEDKEEIYDYMREITGQK